MHLYVHHMQVHELNTSMLRVVPVHMCVEFTFLWTPFHTLSYLYKDVPCSILYLTFRCGDLFLCNKLDNIHFELT